MVKQKLNNKGFSFVELVIAVAILAVIMVSISSFMASTTAVYTRTTKDNEVQIEAQNVYNTITNSIMQADDIVMFLYQPSAASSGNYTVYVSGNHPDAAGVDRTTGKLVKKDGVQYKPLRYLVPMANSTGGCGGYYPTSIYAFSSLKTVDASNVSTYTEYDVKSMMISYQTKNASGNYVKASVTYTVGSDGNLYMNRHVEGEASWKNGSNTYEGRVDMEESADNLLTDNLNYTDYKNCGFKVVVDAESNSIGISLDFKNASFTYESLGMTKIRNSNVLARP